MTPHQPRSGSDIAAFDRMLRSLDRHHRWQRALRGLVWTGAVLILCLLSASVWMSAYQFAPEVVDGARALTYFTALVLLAGMVARPLMRRRAPVATALAAEHNAPQLDALLVSAVAARQADASISADLARNVLRDAVAAGRSHDLSAPERQASRRAALWLGVILALAVLGVVRGPAWIQHSLRVLLLPLSDPVAGSPYTFEVTPGNARVEATQDQLVVASARGFSTDAVTMLVREPGTASWRRIAMRGDGKDFSAHLRSIGTSLEYFVESGGARSEVFTLEVSRKPQLRRIDLVYHFPGYTGREPERVSDGGDILAPRGTRVEVRVHADDAGAGGRLVLDNEASVALEATARGPLLAQLQIAQDNRYQVELADEDGVLTAASPRFTIKVLDDQLPSVALLTPGSDAKVSSIEEIEVSVEALDDIALHQVELVMSINGAAEQVLPFTLAPREPGSSVHRARPTRVVYLEDHKLAPGDLIAYYARARDAVTDEPGRVVATDIFFMEVRPFEREFREMRSGGGGGGGGQQDEQLAAQQRMLVVALFNSVRDRDQLGDAEYHARLARIGGAQERIRARVEAIARRLQQRSIMRQDPGFEQMLRELPKAASAMGEVEQKLDAREGSDARAPARTALLHLQRAEAAFRSVNVSRGANGGGSGDLRDLFRLEMDRFRNQYADVQRGQWQGNERQIERALDQLRELARRQQREVERTRRRAQRGDGEAADSQRALAEEAERMARELERLGLERPELRQLAEQMRKAAEAMRAGADGAGSREALRQIQEAGRRLDAMRPRQLARGLEESLRRAKELEQEQREIAQRLGREASPTARGEAAERKLAMINRLGALKRQLDRVAGQAKDHAPVRDDIRGARSALREHGVDNNLSESRRRLLAGLEANNQEREIGAGLRAARERLERASAALAPGNGQRDGQTREALRDVVRRLGALGEPAAAPGSQSPGSQSPGSQSAESQSAGSQSSGSQSAESQSPGSPGSPGAIGNFAGGGGNGDNRRRRGLAGAFNVPEALRDQAEILRGIAGQLRDPKSVGDLTAVIEGILDLAERGTADATSAARRNELLDTLRQIEYALGDRAGDAAPIAPRQTVPLPEHRQLVESYFRALSEN